MASRSPPPHASQNRRTNSRGVSLIERTLLPSSPGPLPRRSALLYWSALLDRRLLPRGRRLLLLGRRLLLRGRRLLLCPRRHRLGLLLGGSGRCLLLRLGRRRLLLRLGRRRLLLGDRLLRRQRGGVGD